MDERSQWEVVEQAGVAVALFALTVAGAAAFATLLVLAVALGFDMVNGVDIGGALGFLPRTFLTGWVMSMPVVAAGLMLFGLPVDWLLRRLEWRGLPAYAAFGAGGGLLCAALFFPDSWNLNLILATYGTVTAASYWFVFPRRRSPGDPVVE